VKLRHERFALQRGSLKSGNIFTGDHWRAWMFCSKSYKFEIRLSNVPRYSCTQPRYIFEGEIMKPTTRIVSLALGALAIGASTAAMARVDIGVNIGIPAPVYVAPAPVYAPPPPPPVVYQPAPVYAAPAPAIIIGWHGDRYWDGGRWWGRDDWYRHHGGWDHGPRGHGHWDHDRGEHRGWR